MSWAVGHDPNWHRDVGYGVPAQCDHPDCREDIHRGLAYLCGDDIYGGEHGCGLFFCTRHGGGTICERCESGQAPFEPTLDTDEWINHKLTDPSWEQWRNECTDQVRATQWQRCYKAALEVYMPEGATIFMGHMHPRLDGRSPDECIRAGDADRVIALLDALAEGTFS